MTHLSPDELKLWYQRGNVADRERVIGHLADCDQCRKALSMMAAADTSDTPAPAITAVEAVPLGYDARKAAPERSRWAAWLRPAYALGAAAVLVLAFVWVRMPDRAGNDNAVRSTELLALAPSGATGAIEFRWESPFEAARYRISVRDARGVLISSVDATGSPLAASPELRARLVAGGEYTWQVTALDRAGEAIAESRPTGFRYQP
jgi:hypothetical protein